MTIVFPRLAATTATFALALFAAGCSQSTQPVKAANTPAASSEPTGPVTARTAFGPMYKAALAWSSDAQLFRIAPQQVTGFKNEAGKAALWQATFASPSHRQYRIYSYSIANAAPDIHKGVVAGFPLPWSGPTRDAMPIDISMFNVDSDAAYQASASDAAAWLTRNLDKPLANIALGSSYQFQAPVWNISWGDKKSGYIAFVNATSGTVYKHK